MEGAGEDDDDGVEMTTIIMRMKMMCRTTMIRRRRFYIKLPILVSKLNNLREAVIYVLAEFVR